MTETAETQTIILTLLRILKAVATETGHCDLLRFMLLELIEGGRANLMQNFGLIYEVETM